MLQRRRRGLPEEGAVDLGLEGRLDILRLEKGREGDLGRRNKC